jgi:hypothetical protein
MRFYRSLNQAEVKPEEAGSRTGELIIASGLFRKPIYCSTRCQRVAKRGEAPSVKCRATPAVRGAGTRPTAGLAAAYSRDGPRTLEQTRRGLGKATGR